MTDNVKVSPAYVTLSQSEHDSVIETCRKLSTENHTIEHMLCKLCSKNMELTLDHYIMECSLEYIDLKI